MEARLLYQLLPRWSHLCSPRVEAASTVSSAPNRHSSQLNLSSRDEYAIFAQFGSRGSPSSTDSGSSPSDRSSAVVTPTTDASSVPSLSSRRPAQHTTVPYNVPEGERRTTIIEALQQLSRLEKRLRIELGTSPVEAKSSVGSESPDVDSDLRAWAEALFGEAARIPP